MVPTVCQKDPGTQSFQHDFTFPLPRIVSTGLLLPSLKGHVTDGVKQDATASGIARQPCQQTSLTLAPPQDRSASCARAPGTDGIHSPGQSVIVGGDVTRLKCTPGAPHLQQDEINILSCLAMYLVYFLDLAFFAPSLYFSSFISLDLHSPPRVLGGRSLDSRPFNKTQHDRGGRTGWEKANGAQSHPTLAARGNASSTCEHHRQLVGQDRRRLLAPALQIQRHDGQNLRQPLQQCHHPRLCPK